ncbi:non-hydrolyzing UDP-N-acetylglucosamine 2-epimerase [Methanosphaera cuniculi]|uniref:non-hydrolyzing UDP-N-acetylglucosamine 2-epimerase n=1 Tax=Methanosphaera cuniculi TaxID=1077256 RepID=UPI0026F2AF5A|nr:UDP-N-acetylglucosamine 2-epimerase (non-hydrolyzing) [Methanosphaera cuniculi]
MKIAIVLGTRPEIIKVSPIIDEIQKNNTDLVIIHTGQHYDTKMSQQFFEDLNLPTADYNIHSGSTTAIKQVSQIISELEEILKKENPDIVLIQGDTNAVLAGALASNKLKIPVGHIEAGLRSYDKNMPEEINRLVADNCSRLYFVPTDKTAINLLNEGINHNLIYITGNTIVDACIRNTPIAQKKSQIKESIKFDEYITLTLHRAENVDDEPRLKNIIKSIIDLPYNIVFPLHPHTRKSLENADLYDEIKNSNHIQITEPLGYLDFLALMSNSKLLLTDSGGIQEEAITLNIPCVTLRYNTERPETIDAGGNILAGVESVEITDKIKNILDNPDVYEKMCNAKNPYGDGRSAARIYEIIKHRYENNTLNLEAFDNIMDFEGFYIKKIEDNIDVSKYELLNPGCIIQQAFKDGNAVYFDKHTNLKDMNIIVKKFKSERK